MKNDTKSEKMILGYQKKFDFNGVNYKLISAVKRFIT